MKAYSHSRHQHLAALGIPVYRLGLNQVYVYTLAYEGRELILAFDAQRADDNPKSTEADLVKAMVAALKFPARGGYFTQWRLPAECPSVLVLLGDRCATYLANHFEGSKQVAIFTTYSPAEILTDVSLKAPVWQVLKQAMAELTCPQSA